MPDIEQELCPALDLVHVLSARAAAPREPETDLGGRYTHGAVDDQIAHDSCRNSNCLLFTPVLTILIKWISFDITSGTMNISSQDVNGFIVTVQHRETIGTPWVVQTYRKMFFWKRRISSDWFLDGDQAKLFAKQLTGELEHGSELIRNRKPGWTLRRPAH